MDAAKIPPACSSDYLPTTAETLPHDSSADVPDPGTPGSDLQGLISQADDWAQRLYHLDWQDAGVQQVLGDALAFSMHCCMVLVDQVRAAAEGPGPCLLLNSPHLVRTFCELLGRLQLLHTLRNEFMAAIGQSSELTAASEAADGQPVFEDAIGELLYNGFKGIPGSHPVLAGMLQKLLDQLQDAQQQQADSIFLTAALPALLRQYLHHPGREQLMASGKPELLTPDQLEQNLQLLMQTPVLPGYGDMYLELYGQVQDDSEWQKLLQQQNKLQAQANKDEAAWLDQLDRRYSLTHALPDVRKQHDALCDQLSLLAMQIGSIQLDKEKRKLAPDPKVAAFAANTVLQALQYVRRVQSKLSQLDAWRLSAAGADRIDRYQLHQEDALPMLETLTAIKGVCQLFSDSQGWLLPWVEQHCRDVLSALYHQVLPLVSKTAQGNPRVTKLVHAVQTCLSGSMPDLPADLWMREGKLPKPAAAATTSAASEEDAVPHTADNNRLRSRRSKQRGASILDGLPMGGQPVGEGMESSEDETPLVSSRPARRQKERGMGRLEPHIDGDVERQSAAAAAGSSMDADEAGAGRGDSPTPCSSSKAAWPASPGMLLGKHTSNAAAFARARREASSEVPAGMLGISELSGSSSIDSLEMSAEDAGPLATGTNGNSPYAMASPEVLAAVLGSDSSGTSQPAVTSATAPELDLVLLEAGSSSLLDRLSLSQLQPPPDAVMHEEDEMAVLAGGFAASAGAAEPALAAVKAQKGKWRLGKGSGLKSLLKGNRTAQAAATSVPSPQEGQPSTPSAAAAGSAEAADGMPPAGVPPEAAAARPPAQPASPLKRTLKALTSPFRSMRAKFQSASAAAAAVPAQPAVLPAADTPDHLQLLQEESSEMTKFHMNWSMAGSTREVSPENAAMAAKTTFQPAEQAAAATAGVAGAGADLEYAAGYNSGLLPLSADAEEADVMGQGLLQSAPGQGLDAELAAALGDKGSHKQRSFRGFLSRMSPSKHRSSGLRSAPASEAGDDVASLLDGQSSVASLDTPSGAPRRTLMSSLSKRFSLKGRRGSDICSEAVAISAYNGQLPSLEVLQLLPMLLEQLLMELRQDFNHAMLRKFMSAQQADSKFEPTRKVLEQLRVLQAMPALLQFVQKLRAAADLSPLWYNRRADTAAAAAGDQHVTPSFPARLMAEACQQLDAMPAETPLAAAHIWRDAWCDAGARGWLAQQELIQQQMDAAVEGYLSVLRADVFEHFKRLAAHQIVNSELLHLCRAGDLPEVKPYVFDSLLDGTAWDAIWPHPHAADRPFCPFSTLVQQQQLQAASAPDAVAGPAFAPISRTQVQQYLTNELCTRFAEEAQQLLQDFQVYEAPYIVEVFAQLKVLQRSHQLVNECLPLPLRWADLWCTTDDRNLRDGSWRNDAAESCITGIVNMLGSAAFDSHGQLFLPDPSAASAAAKQRLQQRSQAADPAKDVQAALVAAVKPFRAFFGRQHLHALQQLGGAAALWALRTGVVHVYGDIQADLPEMFRELQTKLPEKAELLRTPSCLPTADDPHVCPDPLYEGDRDRAKEKRNTYGCCDAISLHTSYHNLLRGALSQQDLCEGVLSALQHAGNCLAMLHLLSVQRSWHSTPAFMQVAPLLGIWADPGTDSKGLQLADACLRMPPVPDPSSHSNSYFEQMVLGPVAKLVQGLPLQIVQAGELSAWEATRGWDLLPKAITEVSTEAEVLQQQTALTWAEEELRKQQLKQLPKTASSTEQASVQQAQRELLEVAEQRRLAAAERHAQQHPGAGPMPGVSPLQLGGQGEPGIAGNQQRAESASSLEGAYGQQGAGLPVSGMYRSASTPGQDSDDTEGPWVPRSTLPSPGPLGDGLVVVQLSVGGQAAGDREAPDAPGHVPASAQGSDDSPAADLLPAAEASAASGISAASIASHRVDDVCSEFSTAEGPKAAEDSGQAAGAVPTAATASAVDASRGQASSGAWLATADQQQALATAMSAADSSSSALGRPLSMQASGEDLLGQEGSLGSKRSSKLLEAALPELLGQMKGSSQAGSSSQAHTARSTTAAAAAAAEAAGASNMADQAIQADDTERDSVMVHILTQELVHTKNKLHEATQALSEANATMAAQETLLQHASAAYLITPREEDDAASAGSQKEGSAAPDTKLAAVLALEATAALVTESSAGSGALPATASQVSVGLAADPSQASSAAADMVAAAAWGTAAAALAANAEPSVQLGSAESSQQQFGQGAVVNAQMLASVVEEAPCMHEQQDTSAVSVCVDDPGSPVAGDAHDGKLAEPKETTLPRVHHPPSPAVDVALTVSVLRYILLHQVVTESTQDAFAAVASAKAEGPASSSAGQTSSSAAGAMGALLQGTMSLMSSPLKKMGSSAAGVTRQASAAIPPAVAVPAPEATAVATDAGATEAAEGRLVREHLAGGVYGDGPLWACCVLLHVLGQQKAAERLDICRTLKHWHSCNSLRPCPASTAGLDDPDLTQQEAAELAAQHRKEHEQHMAWLERFAAAEGRAQQVWQLARAAVAARFAAAPATAAAPLSMSTVEGLVTMEVTPQPEDIRMMVQADQQVIKPARRPDGHGFGRRSASGGRATLTEAAGAGAVGLPGRKRPTYAPPKAGLVSATLAAEAVARFRAVAPSQAFSASVVRDQDGQTRRSEMASVGTWGGYSTGGASRRQTYADSSSDQASSSKAGLKKALASSSGRLQAAGVAPGGAY